MLARQPLHAWLHAPIVVVLVRGAPRNEYDRRHRAQRQRAECKAHIHVIGSGSWVVWSRDCGVVTGIFSLPERASAHERTRPARGPESMLQRHDPTRRERYAGHENQI